MPNLQYYNKETFETDDVLMSTFQFSLKKNSTSRKIFDTRPF